MYLETIGLYSKSFTILSKTKDPTVKPFDFVTQQGQVTLSRAHEIDTLLLDLHSIYPNQVRLFFLKRAYTDFKLFTILGNINDEALLAFRQYRMFANTSSLSVFDIKFYTNFLELYFTNNISHSNEVDEVIKILKDAYSSEKDLNNRFLIASSLGQTLQEKSWIEAAIEEHDTYYREEYYKILMLNECFEKVLNEQEMLNILWGFLNLVNDNCEDRMMVDLYKQKNSKIYTDLVVECIKRKKYEFLMLISYNWNAFKPENTVFQQIENKNICLLLPNLIGYNGVIFFIKFNDTYKTIPLPSNVSIDEIFKVKDTIEQSWHIVTGQKISYDLDSITEQRRQIDASVKYIELLREFLQIDTLITYFEDIPKDISFEYLETTWLNLPIVSILSSSLSNTFYITSGFEEKKPNPKIQKALIWFNDYMMSYASYELDAITILLQDKNIQIDLLKNEDLNKELFLEKYQDSTYDLIWIITHGQFDYNNPPNSNIYVSKTDTISLWELQKSSLYRKEKRYLILNACYSGCSDVRHNSMGFIGLSSSLTTSYQDVLGHLWFVHDLASATLGIFTLKYLLEDMDLTKAVQIATKNMFNSNDQIAFKLREINSLFEISDRIINNSSIELHQPFYSMSSVIYK